jgi:phosphoglycerate dehydrogenase-like enzyme
MIRFKADKFALVLILFSCTQIACAAEATDAAKAMLAELAIRESKTPVKADPNWHLPQRIVLISSRIQADMDPEILSGLKSAAEGAELLIVSDPEKERDKINGADVLLGSCSQADSRMARLKWVQHFSAGVERCVNNTAFLGKGALLTNMKGVYGPGIAEHVIAMMFSLSRGLHRFQTQQADSKWNRALAGEYPMQELRGKTILVVGLGGIGSEIAWRAEALGMRVIATRNSSRAKPEFVAYVGLADELFTLARQADVVVNATPLTPSTTGLFDKEFFNVLKPSVYFINIGRGKSVITEDLVTALKTGKLAGAALDVVEPEPLPEEHVLWQMPNVIITPHISARSDLVMKRFWIFVRENLRRYVNGERMLNVVDIQKGY